MQRGMGIHRVLSNSLTPRRSGLSCLRYLSGEVDVGEGRRQTDQTSKYCDSLVSLLLTPHEETYLLTLSSTWSTDQARDLRKTANPRQVVPVEVKKQGVACRLGFGALNSPNTRTSVMIGAS